jgi:hypothetical protein
MEPKLPEKLEDLPRPFTRIGERGWADRARDTLQDYGVGIPIPSSASELEDHEQLLGISLPEPYRTVLLELGPVDLSEFRILPHTEAHTLDGFYAKQWFTESERAELPHLFASVEYCGTDDPFALDLRDGSVRRVCHDPPGFAMKMSSFDVLLECAFLGLASGYYGFPDRLASELVQEARFLLTGLRLVGVARALAGLRRSYVSEAR